MSISPSSRRTYQQGQRSYTEFCSHFGFPRFPLSEHILRLFTAYLARSLSFATIQTYLAAVRHQHIEYGFQSNFENMHLLRNLLRGVKRLKGSSVRPKRLPITINVLKAIKNSLRRSNHNNQDQLMLWAAFTTAFFGFLRSSEFCCPTQNSFDPRTTLLVEDVSLGPSVATINLKVSKTDPFRNGQLVRLAATKGSICPHRALMKHLRNGQPRNSPLFRFSNGSYLTRQTLTRELNNLVPATGQKSSFTSHSFRIGAATTAAAANIPDWLIKVLGRWSSDCYQRYINTPLEVIDSIPKKLASS